MYLKRFYDTALAQASYLVGCQATGESIVIDASRHIEPYLAEAKAQGLNITAVTETHIHADYLSGSRELAHETGAPMYLSKDGTDDWQYQFLGERDKLVGDGDVISVGNLTLRVMHTPGHTPEHITFLLTDHPATDKPIGAFTGDFVFVGDVGRPDLLEKAAGVKGTMEQGAKDLYHSLQKFKELPDHIQIWPAHGAGSACGKALGAIPSSVLGYEKIANWAFRIEDEDEFVKAILDGQPEPPKYFAQMKKLNKIGPPLLPSHSIPPKMDDSLLQTVLSKSTLIDLRGSEKFAGGHAHGSLFLPSGGSFVTWAGWLIPYDEDIYLLADDTSSVESATQALRSIGLDNVKGYFLESALKESTVAITSSERIRPTEMTSSDHVIDVRSSKEWASGHLDNAHHIHLGYLKDHLGEVPDDAVLHCGSGVRSLIASSLLEKHGKTVKDVLGGYAAIRSRGLVES